METVIEECNCERSEPVPLSMSSRSLIESRSIEIRGADDKQEAGKCSHFSIRGYVAEIRKRDWKVSWPFSTPDDSDEHANWLPPLHVNEFRWWRCQNCLRTTGATCTARELGAVVNYLSNQVGVDSICFQENAVTASHDGALMPLSGFQQLSEINISEGRKVNEDTCINASSGESRQLICSDGKVKERITLHPLGEDIQASSNGSGSGEENVNQITQQTACGRTIFKPCHEGERTTTQTNAITVEVKGNELSGCSKKGFARGEVSDAGLDIEIPLFTGSGGTGSSHKDDLGLSRSNLVKMKEQHQKVMECFGFPKEVEIGTQNDGSVNAVEGPRSELNSMALDESDYEISKDNENTITSETHDQHSESQLGTSNEVLQRIKSRKVRLLTDIIKSEVSVVSGKNRSSNRDKEATHTDTAAGQSKTAPDASKDVDLHPGLGNHMSIRENDLKTIVGKKRTKTHRVEGKRTSLMTWLKDVAGKVKVHKGYAEKKHNNSAIVNSKSTPDASTRIGLHSDLESSMSSPRKDAKVILGKKQKKKTQVGDGQSLMTWKNGVSRKIKKITENVETEHIGAEIRDSKSEQDAVFGRGPHQGGLKGHGPAFRKAIMNKKRNKSPRVEDGKPSLKRRPKDSSVAPNYKTIPDLARHKKASKKQDARRTNKMPEQETLDDIPMDIVELMAKNQHERCLLNAEDAAESRYKMSEATAGMKGSANAMDSIEVLGKEVQNLLHEKTYSIQKPPPNNAGGGMCITRTNGHPPDITGNYSSGHLNFNQVEQSHASTKFSAVSHFQEKPSSGVHFPVSDSGRNADKWSLACMQFLEACHSNQNISQENICRPAHYSGSHGSGSLIPSKTMPFDINVAPKVDELYDADMFSNAPDLLPRRTKNANGHADRGLTPMNTDLAPHLQKRKGKVVSDMNKGALPAHALSCTEKGNEYRPTMMGPVDLYTNDAIPAMHLLRLMDQGACSSTPIDISTDGKQDTFLKQHQFPQNRYHNFLGLEDGTFEATEPFEFFNQNHQLGNSSKLFSPLLKSGAFGPSVQDVAQKPKDYGRPFGFTGEFSGKEIYSSPKTHGKEKTKSTRTPTQTRGRPRSHGSVLQDGNLGKGRKSVTVHRTKKRLLSAADSTLQSKNTLINGPLMAHVGVMANKKHEIALAVENMSTTGICSVNRNPAEFSIPGVDNMYMIGSEDLRSMSMIPPKDVLRLTNPDGHKRRRMMKLTAIQGR
ncbi:protein EMBRYONIC FLOWER 1 isoform X2 [Magnolia sinica]|uniref:protein EMBRYONIC FLOWER 1 isoform X2 n=1 Tax=Magnolia sinica TaxID=86752 RepID=UPI0026593910|nr:protein EMBRYONIC FLOWER 1 isoform X2 [Magnolia sinica]